MLYTIAFAIIILIICYNTQIVRGGIVMNTSLSKIQKG